MGRKRADKSPSTAAAAAAGTAAAEPARVPGATEWVPIEALREDPENAREHGERDIAAKMASLVKFGQQRALLALPDGTVKAGSGTLTAARRLGRGAERADRHHDDYGKPESVRWLCRSCHVGHHARERGSWGTGLRQ